MLKNKEKQINNKNYYEHDINNKRVIQEKPLFIMSKGSFSLLTSSQVSLLKTKIKSKFDQNRNNL